MKILMTMFGWQDSGGGTIFPRQIAREFKRRGHEVWVFYAAVPQIAHHGAYTLSQTEEDGVRLIGLHNRPTVFLDNTHPEREVCDNRVVDIFTHFLNEFQPDMVHYHNFLGLSLGIAEVVAERGLPSFYTPYNFWLLCPTLYLTLPDGQSCQGVAPNGQNCVSCAGGALNGQRFVQRRDQLREGYTRWIGRCLASSQCVQELMVSQGYPSEKIEVLRLGNQRSADLWFRVGQTRVPQTPDVVHFGFMGSVIPIKGVHILVQAAQLLQGPFRMTIYGDTGPHYLQQLQQLDTRGVVTFAGRFADESQDDILRDIDVGVVPSICLDHSPLVIGEFQAARIPVVGAKIGGIPDYIQSGTGVLFQAADPTDLARVLQSLLDAPETIAQWQAHIHPPIGFDAYVDTLEGYYEQELAQQFTQRQAQRQQYWLKTWFVQGPIQPYTLQPHRWLAPEPVAPYIVAVTDPDAIISYPQTQLAAAQALVVSSKECQIPDFTGNILHLSPWLELIPRPGLALELTTEKPWRLLLTLSGDGSWITALKLFLTCFSAESDVCAILLPLTHDAEFYFTHIESRLAEWQMDPEACAELVVLEPQNSTLNPIELLRSVHGWLNPSGHHLSEVVLRTALGLQLPLRLDTEPTWQYLLVPLSGSVDFPAWAGLSPWWRADPKRISEHNQKQGIIAEAWFKDLQNTSFVAT